MSWNFPVNFLPTGDLHYMAVQLFVSFPMGSFHKGASTILCFFLECFPDISSKTSCYCALSNPFLTPFIKVLQQYQQEHLFPFLTCTFFTLANNICQTQRCPFTFYLLSSVQTFLWHLLTKRRQSFKRNLRQERVSNKKMHDVIQNF